jgi:hypothetical protein
MPVYPGAHNHHRPHRSLGLSPPLPSHRCDEADPLTATEQLRRRDGPWRSDPRICTRRVTIQFWHPTAYERRVVG